VKLREYMPLVLAAVAVGIAIAQAIHPFGNRVPPSVLVVVALLCILRFLLKKQLNRGNRMLKEVPQHPLGISDDHD
jgi:hypothetical protein